MNMISRIFRVGIVPVIGLIVLWFYWGYAAYQDVPGLPIFVITLFITLAVFLIVLVINARFVDKPLSKYIYAQRRFLRLACILIGLGLPVLSILAAANGVGPTEGWDLSGVQFLAVAIALFVTFEFLALLVHIFIPWNYR